MTEDSIVGHDAAMSAARIEILQGKLAALDNWSLLSELIKSCSSRTEAASRLMANPHNFSELQVQHVLDLQLSQLAGERRASMEAELHQLRIRPAG